MKKRGTRALTLKSNKEHLPNSKHSAMELSFGMIFSIILIIAFIAFAFIAIRALLRTQDQAKIGSFVDSLKADMDKVWRSAQASQRVTYYLPGKIKEICFVNHEDLGENVMLIPNDYDFPLIRIDHVDWVKTLGTNSIMRDGERMLCFKNNEKVEMILYKDYGENTVTIKNG